MLETLASEKNYFYFGFDMKKVLTIVSLHEQPSDYAYWTSRPVSERIDAIEILRSQYIQFKKDVKPRLQRVCRVVKQS
jgi:hypothetical protein